MADEFNDPTQYGHMLNELFQLNVIRRERLDELENRIAVLEQQRAGTGGTGGGKRRRKRKTQKRRNNKRKNKHKKKTKRRR